MKFFSTLFFSFFLCLIVNAQSTGDTVVVKVLNYQLDTRDTVAYFPLDTGNVSYEKVIMRYAMRCKDARVSPPIQGRTNEGCGEWDYSCNTYITDSTRFDSISRTISKYLTYPENPSGLYSSSKTWTVRQLIQQAVSIQSITSEDTITLGQGTIRDSSIINTNSFGGKTYLLLDSSELASAGLNSGDIDGLAINNIGSIATLYNLKIQMKHSSLTDLAHPDASDFTNMQEVFFHNATANPGLNRIPFHSAFNWDGSSNLLIEISYKTPNPTSNLKLESHTSSNLKAIASSDDRAFNLFRSNYIDATDYKGISGTGERTVEAWIKTSVANKDIVSWGRNSYGEKFRFRLNSNGALRIEVNGGNKIGTTLLNDDEWHHVALTFNGSTVNDIDLYVDGKLETVASSTSIPINTASSQNVQISGGFHGEYWEGNIDEVRIWSKALPDSVLSNWRYRLIDNDHPYYDDLELNYSIEDDANIVTDNSSNQRDGRYRQIKSYTLPSAEEHSRSFRALNNIPNLTLYQGDYTLTVSNDTIADTTFNTPYNVSENTIISKPSSVLSDEVDFISYTYWPTENQVLDINGTQISSSSSTDTLRLNDTSLTYYLRNASKLEIMSFVTPYGINLDLGAEGKAWYFDVTDFLPILKGNKRITLERGGQNQEEMDIQFFFIVGTPPRDVKDIKQIWRVDSRSYTQITNNEYFEAVDFPLDTSAKAYKLRSIITGHGQQGEFIPRNHFINVNGGTTEFNWQVWMECSENPVFPQGGTWIYDRAGWCPGMPSMVQEYDITDLVGSSSSVNLDYGVSTASGDSRYIVNNQLVSYGAPNFSLDARITEVINPNNNIAYGRFNPVCNDVQIVVQNVGSTPITTVEIDYWINSNTKETYTWNDSLNFLEEATISLPVSNQFFDLATTNGNTFRAEIKTVNGLVDNYSHNNHYESEFSITEILSSDFYIQFITNSAGNESSYDLRNDTGGIVFQRNGMASNTTYRDTFNLGSGCYTLNVYDSDDDGLSFFANNDGNGSIRMRKIGGRNFFKTFNPDFGGGFSYNFTIPSATGLNEINLGESISIFPNPTSQVLTIETTGLQNAQWEVYNVQGQKVSSGRTNSQHHSKFKLNVDQFKDGLYFIRFASQKAQQTKHFMVVH